MPDLRSSRFVRPFTRSGSMFSRLRDQPRNNPNHRHGRSEPDAPSLASSGLLSQKSLTNEPQWAFADGHRRYPAVPAMPGLELLSEAPWAPTNAHPSVRPDLGTAGPDDEPGDDDNDDDESQANNLVDLAQSDELTPWPIETPDDAIDTFELRRSSTFLPNRRVAGGMDHGQDPDLVASNAIIDGVGKSPHERCSQIPQDRGIVRRRCGDNG